MEDNPEMGVGLKVTKRSMLSSSNLMAPRPLSISQAPQSHENREFKGITTAPIVAKILMQLKEVQMLIAQDKAEEGIDYFLCKLIFDNIANYLEELGDNELTNIEKKAIQKFFSPKFCKDLDKNIGKFNDDYRPWGSYDFEKIIKKLDLKTNNMLSWKRKADYIVYELKNILTFLDVANKKYVPGQIYDFLFLANFQEIEVSLRSIRATDMSREYVKAIKQGMRDILLKLQKYERFNFFIYRDFFKNIDNLLATHEKTNGEIKGKKQSSFSTVLINLSEKTKKFLQIDAVIIQLDKIYNLFTHSTFKKNPDDDFDLVWEFEKIKGLIDQVNLDDSYKKQRISQALQNIRLLIVEKRFEAFYSSKMAEIFLDLESRCVLQDDETREVKSKSKSYSSRVMSFQEFLRDKQERKERDKQEQIEREESILALDKVEEEITDFDSVETYGEGDDYIGADDSIESVELKSMTN